MNITKSAPIAALGLGCSQVLFPASLSLPLFCGYSNPVDTHMVSYSFTLGVIGVLCILIILCRKRIDQLFESKRGLAALLMASGSVGCCILFVLPFFFADSGPLVFLPVFVGSLFVGLGKTVAFIGWAHFIAQTEKQSSLVILALSFMMCSLLLLASCLPSSVAGALFVLMPAVAALCWFISSRNGHSGVFDSFSLSSLRKLPIDLICLYAVFIYGGRFIVGIFLQYNIDIAIQVRITDVFFSLLILMLLLIGVFKFGKFSQLLSFLWMPVLLILLIGLTVLILSNSLWAEHLGIGIIVGELRGFEELLIVVFLLTVWNAKASPSFFFATWLLCFKILPLLVERFLAPWFATSWSLFDQQEIVPFVLAVELVVITASFVYLAKRAVGSAATLSGDQLAVTRELVCSLIGKEHGLTSRETEITILLARGYSLKRTSETVFLAQGTVQGYMKSIYRKLDIHSKQELIDMVDRRIKEESA